MGMEKRGEGIKISILTSGGHENFLYCIGEYENFLDCAITNFKIVSSYHVEVNRKYLSIWDISGG